MAILFPSTMVCFVLLHIFVSVGRGNSNLAPMEMTRVLAGGINSTKVDDYHYRCAGNLGPCNYEYCDENCCITQCLSYYNELNPEPQCNEFHGFPYKFCICWHDCY
ncbi:hypothetical protein A4A49_02952 [Nicotiana attenuata]|uniref:Defensin-like protein n=1 Tax=Nicotiana attenuata TaxID=49451 RepID=A0A1J6IP84_NICAT|nr:hypothetical protein A4A49_02952 [Nicotiana attenuata]